MKEPVRTLAYICSKCHQPVIADRTVFSICASHSELPCPCGESKLELDPLESDITVTVPCAACGSDHRATVSQRAFLYEKVLALSCAATGLDCCYVGEEDAVFAAMKRLESAMDHLSENKGEEEAPQGQFLNELVMRESLEELRDKAAQGAVSCTCGSKRWSLDIHYAAIELVCADCGAKLRLPAASQEDLADLCAKTELTIHGRS